MTNNDLIDKPGKVSRPKWYAEEEAMAPEPCITTMGDLRRYTKNVPDSALLILRVPKGTYPEDPPNYDYEDVGTVDWDVKDNHTPGSICVCNNPNDDVVIDFRPYNWA